MDIGFQILCKNLVKKYRSTYDEPSRQRIRNELYVSILPFFQKWFKTALSRKGIYLEPNKLLSVSFDAFCFCLDSYSNIEVPFPSHFSRNIEYFILQCMNKKRKLKRIKEEHFDEENISDEQKGDSFNSGMNIMSAPSILSFIRKNMDDNYKEIFDDAISDKNSEDFLRKKKGGNKYLPLYRYHEARKIFKMIVKILLCGGNEKDL